MATFSLTLHRPSRSQSNAANDSATQLATETLDDILVQSAKRGDEEAFARLIERHKDFCLSKAYSILHNRADAQDEVQTSMMQAWTHIGAFQGQASFRAWLSRIVTNECLMRLRKARVTPLISVDDVFDFESSFRLEVIDQDALPEDRVADREFSVLLMKEIRGIPPLLRKVLVLRDVRQECMQDIANDLGITIPAAKSRLMRARHELRERLMKHCGTHGYGTLVRKPGQRRAGYVRAS